MGVATTSLRWLASSAAARLSHALMSKRCLMEARYLAPQGGMPI